MEFVQGILNKFVSFEWLGSSNFVDSILQRILNSKRLLADHIELLEQCQVTQSDHIGSSPRRKYTFHLANGFALSFLAAASFRTNLKCFHILVPTIATTYGLYVSALTIGQLKNKLTRYRLDDTLTSIEMADAAIRKNISFLRETKLLTAAAVSNRCNQTDKCLKSIAEMIRITYNEVKRLESFLLPNTIESLYEPLEELTTCIYFQRDIEEFSCDDIKAFYNIFLYFQSQFLTRLCLIVCYDQQRGLKYINEESIRLRENLRLNVENLGIWLNESMRQKKRPDANWQERRAKNDAIVSTDVLKMRRSSTDVLCRLIAIVNQYQNTDERLQMLDINTSKQQLVNILNEMNRVNESLCACQRDFETLKLIYTKCLMKKLEITAKVDPTAPQKTSESVPSNIDEPHKSFSSNERNHLEEECKEYFAMRDSKNEEDSDEGDHENENEGKLKWYNELDDIDMKVTRSFFAPVLKQLKTKIDPIKEEMRERELKYLMSKGIDREKIMKFDKNDNASDEEHNNGSDSGSEEDSASNDFCIKTNTKHKINRYDEMRAFLEQKQQIKFLPMGNLPPLSGSEDVLE